MTPLVCGSRGLWFSRLESRHPNRMVSTADDGARSCAPAIVRTARRGRPGPPASCPASRPARDGGRPAEPSTARPPRSRSVPRRRRDATPRSPGTGPSADRSRRPLSPRAGDTAGAASRPVSRTPQASAAGRESGDAPDRHPFSRGMTRPGGWQNPGAARVEGSSRVRKPRIRCICRVNSTRLKIPNFGFYHTNSRNLMPLFGK